VRLTQLEARSELAFEGTTRDRVVLTATADGVREASGRVSREILLEPDPGARAIRVDGCAYPGSLRVRARSDGTFEVLATLDLEDYVEGVVAAELVLWSARPAELEAQAIASRSYALAQLQARLAHTPEPLLVADTRDQAYRGSFQPSRFASSAQVAERLRTAVARTRGRILVEGTEVVDARFHASCGGRTADVRDLFPEAARFACMRPVDCEPCSRESAPAAALAAAPRMLDRAPDLVNGMEWTCRLAQEDLDALAASFDLGQRLLGLSPAARDASGRWLSVQISGERGSKTLAFEDFRQWLSPGLAPGALASSLVTEVAPRAGERLRHGLVFRGRGRGHGVGLCQCGAHGYALLGWSAERILAHYYPGAQVADGF
jgi:stage II sporulation protein D (peptidoglycan lytic transglycosylase)